jgi:hypothetical protein
MKFNNYILSLNGVQLMASIPSLISLIGYPWALGLVGFWKIFHLTSPLSFKLFAPPYKDVPLIICPLLIQEDGVKALTQFTLVMNSSYPILISPLKKSYGIEFGTPIVCRR